MAETPSLLSFERSIHPTDFTFTQLGPDGVERPISVRLKTALGTHSQYVPEGQQPEVFPNPQPVEHASLDPDASTLRLCGNLTITASSRVPFACDVPEWRQRLRDVTAAFARADGYRALGRRYALNLANGRFTWKNRILADTVTVTLYVHTRPDGPMDHNMSDRFVFDALEQPMSPAEPVDNDVAALGELIGDALGGEVGPYGAKIEVVADLALMPGSQVHPSQEFFQKADNDTETPGKILHGVPYMGAERCAAYHEQKVGAALRTIDTWHGGAHDPGTGEEVVEPGTPLPVNPFAPSRQGAVVVRNPKKRDPANRDLYAIMRKRVQTMARDIEANGLDGEACFLVANLIRGGVFGYEKKKKNQREQASETVEAST